MASDSELLGAIKVLARAHQSLIWTRQRQTNALRSSATNYPGDNSTSTGQLVLFLRAGYFVQWYNESTVGAYGPEVIERLHLGRP